MDNKKAFQHAMLLVFIFIIGIFFGTMLIPVSKSDGKISPSDYFKTDDVSLSPDKIIINNSHNASMYIGTVTATGSMIPMFDENAMTINVVPKSPCEINIGDIIVYEEKSLDKSLIIHRVVNITGDYAYITQGDNNLIEDDPVGFSQIKYKVVGIIY